MDERGFLPYIHTSIALNRWAQEKPLMGGIRFGWLALLLLTAGLPACTTSTKHAVESAGLVAEDTRKYERIPDQSAPEVAQAAMGRRPDAVQRDGDREIHYYLVRGAADGEALRLVYRQGKLIDRQVVQVANGH